MGYGKDVRQVIGARIAEFRSRKGVTQKELARELGVTTSFVTKIETGVRAVPDGQMAPLMKILGASVSDLMTNQDGSTSQKPAFSGIEGTPWATGDDDVKLGMGLLHYYLKGSTNDRVALLKELQDRIMLRKNLHISDMKFVESIRSYVRNNDTKCSELDEEIFG